MDASTLRFIMKLGAMLGKGPCIPVFGRCFGERNLDAGSRLVFRITFYRKNCRYNIGICGCATFSLTQKQTKGWWHFRVLILDMVNVFVAQKSPKAFKPTDDITSHFAERSFQTIWKNCLIDNNNGRTTDRPPPLESHAPNIMLKCHQTKVYFN